MPGPRGGPEPGPALYGARSTSVNELALPPRLVWAAFNTGHDRGQQRADEHGQHQAADAPEGGFGVIGQAPGRQ